MRIRCGFTIIELLIVVSIIAILIAILMPVLGTSKEAARMTVCMSNMRQFAEAWHGYAADNDGFLACSDNNVENESWVYWATSGVSESVEDLQAGTLWDYVRTVDLYRCPGEDRIASDGNPYLRSYSISAYLNGRHYQGRRLGQTPASSVDGIHQPDETFMMLDEADPRDRVRGAFQVHPHGALPRNKWRWIDWPAQFHFEGFPLSFADGRVEFRRYEDSRTKTIDKFFVKHPGSADWLFVADHFNPGESHNP